MTKNIICKSYTYLRMNGIYSLATLALARLRISPNGLLQRIFGFNAWHINAYSSKPYAQAIVTHLNKRTTKGSVLEIGCGLGDILRRLEFKKKMGFDREQEVLNAAVFVSKIHNVGGGSVEYTCFDLLQNDIDGVFDVVIMVNWIHEIPTDILAAIFKNIFANNLSTYGELIFDVLDNPDYKYNHSALALTSELVANTSLVGQYDYNRNIYSASKLIL
jgi:SAM-dependent methyltransferase